MDSILKERLNNLSTQNKTLEAAEAQYLLKEAGLKPMEAEEFLTVIGSIAERQAKAHTTEMYVEYVKELATLKARYNFERRKFEILDKAYLAEYLTLKRESTLIDRGAE